LEEVRGTGNRVAVAFSWRTADGSRSQWAQLLTVSDGKIGRMLDYAKPARALRAVAG
jgi:hypothetical protein